MNKKEMDELLRKPTFQYSIAAVKVAIFYLIVQLNPLNHLIGIVSCSILAAIFLVIREVKFKQVKIAAAVIYTLITVMMFLDALYYIEFYQYISWGELFQINLIEKLEGISIPGILHLFILFLDLPLVYYNVRESSGYLGREKRPKRNKKGKIKNQYTWIAVPSTILVMILFLGVNPLQLEIFEQVSHMEFFTYHIREIVYSDTHTMAVSNLKDNLTEFHSLTETNRYKGIVKNKNLIVIQMNSLPGFVIGKSYNGQEVTPHMNRLIGDNTLYFENYYQNITRGNVPDGEFISLNGILPVTEGNPYQANKNKHFNGLPAIMKENGYETSSYYGGQMTDDGRDEVFEKMGFDRMVSSEQELSDKMFMSNVSRYFPKAKKKAFHFLIMSSNPKQYQLNDERVKLQLEKEDENTLFGQYMISLSYQDEAIGELIRTLKNKGTYNDFVIVVYGAKSGLETEDENAVSNIKSHFDVQYNEEEMLRSPLLVHLPDTGIEEEDSTIGSQIDLLPTLVNMMDLEHNNAYMIGQDLLNTYEGFVPVLHYGIPGSFIKEPVILLTPRSGGYEDAVVFSCQTGEKESGDSYERDYNKSCQLVEIARAVLEQDLFSGE